MVQADQSGLAEVTFVGFDWDSQRAWKAPAKNPAMREYIGLDAMHAKNGSVFATWPDGKALIVKAINEEDFWHLTRSQVATQKNPLMETTMGENTFTLNRLDAGKTYLIKEHTTDRPKGKSICQILMKNFGDPEDIQAVFAATKFCSVLFRDFSNGVFAPGMLKQVKDKRLEAMAPYQPGASSGGSQDAPVAPGQAKKRPAAAAAGAADAAGAAAPAMKRPATAMKRPATASAEPASAVAAAEGGDDDLDAETEVGGVASPLFDMWSGLRFATVCDMLLVRLFAICCAVDCVSLLLASLRAHGDRISLCDVWLMAFGYRFMTCRPEALGSDMELVDLGGSNFDAF